MPDDPTTWIVAIIVVGAVVAFAIWRGNFVEFQAKPFKLRFKRDAPAPGAEGSGISVGKGMKITGSKVGDIAGVKTSGPAGARAPRVSVGEGARIEDSEAGDIAGVKSGGGKPRPDEKPAPRK
jgi:hypothetical protein